MKRPDETETDRPSQTLLSVDEVSARGAPTWGAAVGAGWRGLAWLGGPPGAVPKRKLNLWRGHFLRMVAGRQDVGFGAQGAC